MGNPIQDFSNKVRFAKVREGAVLPARGSERAAGLDLFACVTGGACQLYPGERTATPLGVAVELPIGTVGLMFARSGAARKHGLSMVNGVGVVDEDFRGEMHALLINHGECLVKIDHGERVAQLVIVPVLILEPIEASIEELTQTKRGDAGFGSSGRF